MKNLLFVCSRNQWRSPTAEKIYSKNPYINSRSVGTSPKAKRSMSLSDVKWADCIFVMEKKHKQRLIAAFPEAMEYKDVYILDIDDNYKFMDPELIEAIYAIVDPILESF